MKIQNQTPSLRMNMQNTTSIRQTKDTSFGAKLQQGLGATANIVGGAAAMAIPNLPGGNVISAAMAGAKGSIGSSTSALTAGAANSAPIGAAGAAGAAAGGGGLNGALPPIGGANTGSNSVSSAFSESKQMFEMQAGFNMKFLNLQNKMQNETRSFQTMSNVLKNRSDTAKNSIRNIN